MKAARFVVQPEGGAFPGVDTALADSKALVREQLHNLAWLDDGTYALLYRLTGDPARVRSVLGEHPEVIDLAVARVADHAPTDRVDVFVHAEGRSSLSELLAITRAHALVLEPPFEVTEDGVAVTVVGEADALRKAFAEASEHVSLGVVWSGGYDPAGRTTVARLTDRQREALEVATDLGFYERPRRTDFEEIGAALDCAPSTANELLRRAEATLVTATLRD